MQVAGTVRYLKTAQLPKQSFVGKLRLVTSGVLLVQADAIGIAGIMHKYVVKIG